MSIKINKNVISLFGIQYSSGNTQVRSTKRSSMSAQELIARMKSQVASLDRAILRGMDSLKIAEP